MTQLKIFDVVALLKDLPNKNIGKGQVGTIVEKLDDNVFAVEFCDNSGQTISLETLNISDLFLLHFEQQSSPLNLH